MTCMAATIRPFREGERSIPLEPMKGQGDLAAEAALLPLRCLSLSTVTVLCATVPQGAHIFAHGPPRFPSGCVIYLG